MIFTDRQNILFRTLKLIQKMEKFYPIHLFLYFIFCKSNLFIAVN